MRGDTVVLVHGLWLNALIMRLMQWRIERHGYRVNCYSYPTVRLTIEENAERLANYCERMSVGRLHLVGHSMGGLVLLNALRSVALPCLGRIVLAGTPFAGSFSGRRLSALPAGRKILGRCMRELLNERHCEPLERFEIGVIAGDGGVGLGRLIAPDLPKPNDGVVAVDETRVPGMRDHIVINVSHTAMLASRQVADQICAFLDDGRFKRVS